MGDPAGIGPEVVVKFCAAALETPSVDYRFVVVGDGRTLERTAAALNASIRLQRLDSFHEGSLVPDRLNCLDLHNVKNPVMGRAGEACGRASVEYVLKALDLAKAGGVDAITTAPICKEAIHMAGFPYPGHTELLAEGTGTRDFAMMMVGGRIRVVLTTIHIPMSRVSGAVTLETVSRIIRLTDRSLTLYEGGRPDIAVAALNPHAGEAGAFGKEEQEHIIPAVQACRREGIQVSGPYPADSLFARVKKGAFDVVVVMYHDQGLIPVKMEGFETGVNVTLGLPIIRTSVDHGVAFDIAGKGCADPSSMRAAVHYAVRMARQRGKETRPI